MADRPLLAALRWRCTLLIRSRSATAALRVVSCQVAVYSLGGGGRPEYSLTFAPGLPGEPGNVGWPRTLRGASTGHSGRTARNTTGRPSRAHCRPPGTKTKPEVRGQRTAPPGHLAPLAWPGDNSRSFPAVAAPVSPRGHQKHVSTLRPPFPPSPPSHLIGSAVQAVGRRHSNFLICFSLVTIQLKM